MKLLFWPDWRPAPIDTIVLWSWGPGIGVVGPLLG